MRYDSLARQVPEDVSGCDQTSDGHGGQDRIWLGLDGLNQDANDADDPPPRPETRVVEEFIHVNHAFDSRFTRFCQIIGSCVAAIGNSHVNN